MSDNAVRTLLGLVEGDTTIFQIKIPINGNVLDLQTLVKEARKHGTLRDVDAAGLVLWKVNIHLNSLKDNSFSQLKVQEDDEKMQSWKPISNYWPSQPPNNRLHVIVQRRPAEFHQRIPPFSAAPASRSSNEAVGTEGEVVTQRLRQPCDTCCSKNLVCIGFSGVACNHCKRSKKQCSNTEIRGKRQKASAPKTYKQDRPDKSSQFIDMKVGSSMDKNGRPIRKRITRFPGLFSEDESEIQPVKKKARTESSLTIEMHTLEGELARLRESVEELLPDIKEAVITALSPYTAKMNEILEEFARAQRRTQAIIQEMPQQ